MAKADYSISVKWFCEGHTANERKSQSLEFWPPYSLLNCSFQVEEPVMRTELGLRVLCRHDELPLACFLYLSTGNSKPSVYVRISATPVISSPYISSLEMVSFGKENCISNLSFVWTLRNLGKTTRLMFLPLLRAVCWVSQLSVKRISFLGT